MSSYQIQQLLITSKAKYIESSKPDILSALQQFKDIVAETESHLFPDGKRRLAFTLRGTIPVVYKGGCYNIPIAVYLWDTHPYYAPVCFVRPTSTMVVKESESVNKEGRIFLPYLNEWRYPGYDLVTLLQIMSMIFQERCPVFAKSTSSSKVTSTATSTPVTTNQPSPSVASNPTPYPTASYPTGIPTPYPANAASFPTPNTPYPMGSNSINTPYMNSTQTVAYPGARPVRPSPPLPPGTIQSDTIRASLISALEDKFRLRLRDQIGTNYAEMASISQTKKELQAGQIKLKQMIDELESAQNGIDGFIRAYSAKKSELDKAILQNNESDSSIDSSIDATTPLHKQLLDNYASDLACDDTIYTLGQARIKGVLSLQDYLRHVRSISRKQFEYRATMQKCRRVAGLPL